MKLNVFCYYDAAAESYGTPIFDDHEPNIFIDKIKKSVKYALATGSTNCNFMKTVKVYFMGSFDDDSGKFDICKEYDLLLDASSLFPVPVTSDEN